MLRHTIKYLVAVNSKRFQREGALIDLYCLVGNYYYGFSAKFNDGHGDGQHRGNGKSPQNWNSAVCERLT